MDDKWLEWAKQLQAIAQAGLTYSKDVYDLERFEMIREISVEMLALQSSMDKQIVRELFANETGYATPKVDIRVAVLQENKLLLVKENADGAWALPGGWADIGCTPSEVAVKEVKEESGFDVQVVKLLGIMDKKCHPHPPSPYHVYKMFIHCEIIGGEALSGIETAEVAFFAENELPILSEERNTLSQIEWVFKELKNPREKVYMD